MSMVNTVFPLEYLCQQGLYREDAIYHPVTQDGRSIVGQGSAPVPISSITTGEGGAEQAPADSGQVVRSGGSHRGSEGVGGTRSPSRALEACLWECISRISKAEWQVQEAKKALSEAISEIGSWR